MSDNCQPVLLEAKNLSIAAMLWNNLSLKASAGQLLQITGSNGSGKTTLIKVLCGLMRPDRGWVRWQQRDIYKNADDYRQAIAYVGHEDGIKVDLTPEENLAFAVAIHGESGADISTGQNSSYADVLGRWQLSGISVPCRMLSAGQRRRSALARLMMTDAHLWFLDEPLTTLDRIGCRTLDEIIGTHLESGGAVIMSTHQKLDWSLPSQVLSLDAIA